ncbi:Glycosyltransferase family 10 (fucosyltransferase) C-term, putative [Angomonas deanei]|uniref:Fucosyltransferase n=1 Tax=Angomonas deanei TaxID=59799 RepID=A0A7G2CNI9_9TRYP|nr:Glycosyltransferase family 10 (fucosyltransferase) C-term, putative [Angomonas deanei]
MGESFTENRVYNPHYLEQYDELVVLPGMTPEVYWKGIYGPSVAREMAASLKIRNWSMGHQSLAAFNVLLEVNRRLRDGSCAHDALCGLPEGEEQQRRLSSTERVTRDVLQSYRSGSPLHLVDLSLSTDPALNTPALVHPRRVERWKARESAIAILLASCVNKRTDQLDRIARYYPVHNYGKCKGKRLINRRIQDLKCGTVPWTPLTVNLTEGRSVRVKSFPLKERYQAVRCVIRHYKYFMVFENNVEKGYVTEKVYNALLGGAVPLVFGTSEVADHVPRPDSIVELLKHFKFHNRVTRVHRESIREREAPLRTFSKPNSTSILSLENKRIGKGRTECDVNHYPDMINILYPSDSEEPYEALGDYLRELEEDDEQLMRLFAWRDVTDVSQWSESFRRIVYGPSPMCNLCAEVLQEKRKRGD